MHTSGLFLSNSRHKCVKIPVSHSAGHFTTIYSVVLKNLVVHLTEQQFVFVAGLDGKIFTHSTE